MPECIVCLEKKCASELEGRLIRRLYSLCKMFLKRKKKTFSQFWFIRAYTLMTIYFAVVMLLKRIMNYVIVIFVITT